MKKEYLFSAKDEKLQEYLARMARVLDDLREMEESPVVSEEEKARIAMMVREIKNYIAEILQPDVKKTAKNAAFKNGLVDEQGVVFSYLMMDLLDHLYKYNNPRYTSAPEPRSFDAFAGPYVRAAVDNTLGEKRGVNKHLRKRIRHIDKTIQFICLEYSKDPDSVGVDEIFDNQHKVGDKMFLSKEVIQDTLIKFVEDPVHFDSIEDFELEYRDDYRAIENEEALECVIQFLKGLTDTKKFLFVGRALIGEGRPSYKELSVNSKFLDICRMDDLYSKHILRGDMEILRSKADSNNNGLRKDVEYIDPDFLETQFRTMKKQFRRLENHSKELELLDLLAALNVVMADIWDKLNR